MEPHDNARVFAMIALAVLIIGGLYLAFQALPMIIALATNVIYLVVFLVLIIAYVVVILKLLRRVFR